MLSHHQYEAQISRLCLNGTGIICGLDVCTDEDYGVYVKAGNGITSDGRYIEFSHSQCFRFYQHYSNDYYSLFEGVDKLWELTNDPSDEPLKPQSSSEELNPFLKDKVLVLYVDSPIVIVVHEADNNSTDERNIETPCIRFILMRQSDLLRKLKKDRLVTQILWSELDDDDDFIYNDDYNPEDTRPRIHTLNLAMNPALRLPELYLRRLGFSSGDPFNCPPEGVDTSVFPEIKSLNDLYNAYVPIIDEASKALDKALTKLYLDFKSILDCNQAHQVQGWIALLCEKWEAYKREIDITKKKYYIQYFYDWMRDLIQAYNELRWEIIQFVGDCCLDANVFPQHLLLGIMLRDDLARQPKPLRHNFKQPPIYNGNADRLQRLRLYSWRILMMIKGFYLPDYARNNKVNPHCEPVIEEEGPDMSMLKITPGRFYDAPLGDQTIPYYYQVSWSRFSVHHFWNYERAKTCSTDQLLSYHASDLDDSYTTRFHVIRPLHYNLNNYPFFRIEGHIGRSLEDYLETDSSGVIIYKPGVLNELQNLKQKYNLSIQFIAVEVSLTDDYEFKVNGETATRDSYVSFSQGLLGMEHIAGVKEGGTFILIYEVFLSQKIAVADFFLPCCIKTNQNTNNTQNNSGSVTTPKVEIEKGQDKKALLLEKIGIAHKNEKDDLQQIKGIGPKYEKSLNDLGIYTLKQISKMTDAEYDILDELIGGQKGKGKQEEWTKQAQIILAEKL